MRRKKIISVISAVIIMFNIFLKAQKKDPILPASVSPSVFEVARMFRGDDYDDDIFLPAKLFQEIFGRELLLLISTALIPLVDQSCHSGTLIVAAKSLAQRISNVTGDQHDDLLGSHADESGSKFEF